MVCMCSNRTVLQKCGRDINCSLDYSLWVKNSNVPKSKSKKGSILADFSSNKSPPANIKTGFYANRDPNKQEVGFFFAWSGSELLNLFKYSTVKLKNQKPIAVLFKAYPMVPLSCRSTLAKRYIPLKVGGNEKNEGSGRSQMLDNGLGPWRLRFIFNLNMQFLIKMSYFLFRL